MNTPIQGAGLGGCFVGDTMIATPIGERRIDELQENDIIYSFDDKGIIVEGKITAVHYHEKEPVCRYTVWGGSTIDATPNHWVLNQYNAFVAIGSLENDDCLVDKNNHLRPIVNREDIGMHPVYNLTIEKYHTFIAGGIRVHNAGLGLGLIAGAGGKKGKGKGGAREPITTEDSLNSEALAIVVDVIGEGEIEGFPSAVKAGYEFGTNNYLYAALKDIYLDKTPIVKNNANVENLASSDWNFKIIDFACKRGINNQSTISGLADISNEKSVGVLVAKGYPVPRNITDVDVDKVRVTLNFPALQEFQNNGDILGSKVQYQISLTSFGGSPVVVVDNILEGRTGDNYQKQHVVDLTGYAFPVTVTVSRVTDNSSNPKAQNDFYWASYTEITSAKIRYPNTAYAALAFSARDFSSIPTRSFKIRGLKILIPSNATVDINNGRLIYSGIWDGSFGIQQWTTDPAWILWDMLTNCRYGLGQHIHSTKLDKFSFYQASQYCSELVPNGKGGYEPRFSCNVVIQNQDDAYKVINNLTSVFRAMPYWSAGALLISQDRPTDPTFLFNNTNITEEGFQYSGSSLKTRHTVAIVSWFDNEQQELVYEAVEDPAGIAKYGAVVVSVEGFGCTTQGQAHRLGEWLLYSEQNETEIINFKTTLEAAAGLTPGQVIAVMDKLRSGVRRGGRIKSATTTTLRVDEYLATNMPTSGSPTVMAMLPDGTSETRPVVAVAGDKITVNPGFSIAPIQSSPFIYNNNDQSATNWRVVSVKEEDRGSYVVNALSYNSSKYDYIERGTNLIRKTYLPLDIPTPDPPVSITSSFTSVLVSGALTNRIFISWPANPNAAYYVVNYRLKSDGAWRTEETQSPTIEIDSPRDGIHEVQISAVNGIGEASISSEFNFNIDPYSLPMEDVSNLQSSINGEITTTLTWNVSTRSYILSGGSVIIKHEPVLTGATWSNATTLSSVPGSSIGAQVPLLTGTYLVKFQAASGQLSTNATSIVVTAPLLNTLNAVTYAEHLTVPPFDGQKINMRYDAEDAGLLLEGGVYIDSIGIGQDWDSFGSIDGYTSLIDNLIINIDELGTIDSYPSVDDVGFGGGWDALESIDTFTGGAVSGEYYFDVVSPFDLGGVFNVYVKRSLYSEGYSFVSDIDTRVDLIDTWTDFDAVSAELANAAVQVQSSNDGLNYTEWTNFSNNLLTGRYFQFRAIAETPQSSETILIKELGASIDIPRRTETNTVTGNGAISFSAAFYQAPSVVVSGNNAQTGDYYQVTSITRTGMTVIWYDSSNTPVVRTFNYQAIGFGSEIP